MDNSCIDTTTIWESAIYIPELSKLSLNDIIEHRRLNACTLRYVDTPEHMVFLNANTWKKLKFEIVNNRNRIPDYYEDDYDDYLYDYDDIDKEEKKFLRFKDKYC